MLRMQGDGLGGVRGRSCQKPCPRQQPLLWDPGVALSVTDNPGLGTDHCFPSAPGRAEPGRWKKVPKASDTQGALLRGTRAAR